MGQEAKEQRKEGRAELLVLQMRTKRDSVGQLKANLICPERFKDPGSSTESLVPNLSQVYLTVLAGVRPAPACTPAPRPPPPPAPRTSQPPAHTHTPHPCLHTRTVAALAADIQD